MVKFTVYGEPKAKGRPRVSVRKSADGEKTFARAYTPKNTVMYEKQNTEFSVITSGFQMKQCWMFGFLPFMGFRKAFQRKNGRK